MRATDAVAAHFFQYLQLPLDGTDIDCRPKASQIMVHAHTVYLHMFPVEPKARPGIKLKMSHAGDSIVSIYATSVYFKFRPYLI